MALLVIIASMIFGAISGVVAVFIYDRHIGLLTRADYDNLIEAEREFNLKMINAKNDAVMNVVMVELSKNESQNMEFVNNTISMWQREQEALLAKINSDYEQHKRWSLGVWNNYATLKEHINEIPTEIIEELNPAFNTKAAEPEEDIVKTEDMGSDPDSKAAALKVIAQDYDLADCFSDEDYYKFSGHAEDFEAYCRDMLLIREHVSKEVKVPGYSAKPLKKSKKKSKKEESNE